jgi:hypothetical protein
MEASGQLHDPAALSPEKQPLLSIGKEVGWTPEPPECRDEEKNSQPFLGLEPPLI